MSDDDDLRALRAAALARTGAADLHALARSPSVARLEPDLAAVLRLRLGLDRDPPRPRTRPEVAEALGLGGARIEEMVRALEEDVQDALGPAAAER
jgi:hypothetical protein